MAGDDEKQDFRPGRTENILKDESESTSNAVDTTERISTMSSESSTEGDSDGKPSRRPLSRTATSMPRAERFEPLDPADREELHRIATYITHDDTLNRTISGATAGTAESRMEKQDTLAGVKLGDPVLDPKSPDFDVYKWVRM